MTRAYELVEIMPFWSASLEDTISQDPGAIFWKCAKQVSEKHRSLSIRIFLFNTNPVWYMHHVVMNIFRDQQGSCGRQVGRYEVGRMSRQDASCTPPPARARAGTLLLYNCSFGVLIKVYAFSTLTWKY